MTGGGGRGGGGGSRRRWCLLEDAVAARNKASLTLGRGTAATMDANPFKARKAVDAVVQVVVVEVVGVAVERDRLRERWRNTPCRMFLAGSLDHGDPKLDRGFTREVVPSLMCNLGGAALRVFGDEGRGWWRWIGVALEGVVAAVVAVGDTDCEKPSRSEASLFIGVGVNF